MAGLLDFINSPAGIGLLSGLAGGMAGARRGQPINSIGRGAMVGLQGYQGAQDQVRQDKNAAFDQQYKQSLMDKLQAEIGQRKAMQDASTQAAQSAMTPGSHGPMGYKPTDPQAFAGQFAQGSTPEDQEFNQANMGAIAEGNNALAPEPQGRFDPAAYRNNMTQNLAAAGMGEEALKYAPDPKENKPQLVTVYGADGRPMQKWVRPGEAEGVDVGMGKAEGSALGKLIAERDSLPEGHPARAMYNQAIDKATTHAPSAQLNNYGSPVAGVGPDGKQVYFQTNKGGGAASIVPGITPMPPKPEQPTGEENTSAGYLGRMQAAERLVGTLAGGEPTEGTSVAGAIPFIGDYVQRKTMNTKQQQYKQASDDWIRAKLRKESGAVIGDVEMRREYQTYFPQPGDQTETIKQKAMARRQAEEQMIQSAGRAAPKLTEAEFTKAETDYIAKRRAAGIPDQEISLELQRGAANAKSKTAKDLPRKGGNLSASEQKELAQLRQRFNK